jgi:UDP-glucose 4-epimerase
MRVLVTGGAGFIGSHVADLLLADGHAVVILDDLSGGAERNLPETATFVHGSVVDDALVTRLFAAHRFDIVYHLAAYAAEGLSPFIRRFNYTNNLIGTVNLINAAVMHGTRRFVFTSSIAVYGPGQTPMAESLIPRPVDPYGIAKFAAEMDLAAAFEQFGLEYAILRPHNVYGERQHIADPYRNVVGIFMRCALTDRPMPVFGDGSQSRAFSYINDVAPAIVRAGFEPGARNEIFNVGADTPVTVRDLATEIARLFNVPCRIETLPARHEVAHAFSSHDKARRVFGLPPATPLSDGLARMATWVRQTGAGVATPFAGIEIARGLPPSWARLQ